MTEFARRILEWYQRHARNLPWRVPPGAPERPDPYAVWVSEIMLQQTRVEAVIPYFARWMERFPTLERLSAAPEEEVLALWEGLGYYSRARNLHRAAQIVLTEHGGRLPESLPALRKLPGIGRYTAAAIASIAFGQDAATLDGNLKRVFARVFDLTLPADSAEGEAALWHLAEIHLPPGRAGDYNQALMDLGATLCLPRSPRCLLCPVRELCQAHARGVQEQRPVTPSPPRSAAQTQSRRRHSAGRKNAPEPPPRRRPARRPVGVPRRRNGKRLRRSRLRRPRSGLRPAGDPARPPASHPPHLHPLPPDGNPLAVSATGNSRAARPALAPARRTRIVPDGQSRPPDCPSSPHPSPFFCLNWRLP